MTNEEIYEKVMGHKPNKEFGVKGSFSWNDIDDLMNEAVKNCSTPVVMPCFSLDEIKERSEKWAKSRSEGNEAQDIDCMYDYAQGMSEMQRLLTNKV